MKKKRPEIVQGWTRRIQTGCGKLYVTVNELEEKPFEIFCKLGKAGGCAASQVEAIGRLVAMALRSGVGIGEITKQLIGISCHMPVFNAKGGRILSCSDGIAQVLAEKYAPDTKWEVPPSMLQEEEGRAKSAEETVGEVKGKSFEEIAREIKGIGACPECGGQIRYEEGCRKCSCGWTEC